MICKLCIVSATRMDIVEQIFMNINRESLLLAGLGSSFPQLLLENLTLFLQLEKADLPQTHTILHTRHPSIPQNNARQSHFLRVQYHQICAFSLAKSHLDIIQIHLWFVAVLDAGEVHAVAVALLEKSVEFLALTQPQIPEDTNGILLHFFLLFALYSNQVGRFEVKFEAPLPRHAPLSLLRKILKLLLPTPEPSLLALPPFPLRTVRMRKLHNLVHNIMVLRLTLLQKQRIQSIEHNGADCRTLLAATQPLLVDGTEVMADPPDLIQQVCRVMVHGTFGPVADQQYEERHSSVLFPLAGAGKQLSHPFRSMHDSLVIYLPTLLLKPVRHHQQLEFMQKEQSGCCSEKFVKGEEAGVGGAVCYGSQERIYAFCSGFVIVRQGLGVGRGRVEGKLPLKAFSVSPIFHYLIKLYRLQQKQRQFYGLLILRPIRF